MTWIKPRFGEQAEVAVGHAAGQFRQGRLAILLQTRVAQQQQVGLQVLGQDVLRHGVVDQSPGQGQFADAGAAPVDDLRGQHAADAQLLAKAEQQHVDAGGVHVGQFGQVADAHHHFRLADSGGAASR